MNADTRKAPPLTSFSLRTLRAFILVATAIVTYAGLVLPLSLRPAAPPLKVGDVAPLDMQAPRNFEYVSEVRTEEARQAAEKAVQPVYTAPDPAIARQQINQLRSVFATISAIRLDTTSTTEAEEHAVGGRCSRQLHTGGRSGHPRDVGQPLGRFPTGIPARPRAGDAHLGPG